MAFAIKAEVRDLRAKTFVFTMQNTMDGGKYIAEGDTTLPTLHCKLLPCVRVTTRTPNIHILLRGAKWGNPVCDMP